MNHNPIRILFVDDSPEIIDLINRMVEVSGNDWYVRTADGGVEALDLIESDHFDVIVTDLQMPEINGVKLLKYTQKHFPEMIRMVFSGSLTKKAVREVAAYTQRFIAKPCDTALFIGTIENTLFIHRDLDNAKIRKVLTKTGSIPSLPRIYQELMAKIDDEDFSLKDAAKLISSDIGMSANILKQINLLGNGDRVSSVEQAVMLLGLDSIKAIALSSHIFTTMKYTEIENFSLEQLVRHSMLTAKFAKEITLVETEDQQMAERAFVAGVLHDMGAILFAENFHSKYGDVLNRVVKAKRPIADVERNLLGISHGEIGAHLLALWGFPKEVLAAVAYHEDPEKSLSVSFSLLTAVYIGSYLAHIFDGDREYPDDYIENSAYLKELSCGSRYPLWEEQCRKIYSKVGH